MSRVSAWWSSLGFGKPERRADTDYADMGTAFGLDASFGREDIGDASVAIGTDRYPGSGADPESPRGQAVVPRKGPAGP